MQGGTALLPGFTPSLQEKARAKIMQQGGEIHFETHVASFDGNTVQCREGLIVPARTLIWSAGVTANPVTDKWPLKTGHAGRIIVDPHMRLPHDSHTFIVGDLACNSSGQPWPQVAPFAVQSGRHIVKMIHSACRNTPLPPPFTYKNPGSLAVLGRYDAVCQMEQPRIHCHGLLAWLLWATLHLYRIIGTRSRLITMIDWAYDYFSRGSAVEIIRKPQ
jgi:NADH dehydrogenase